MSGESKDGEGRGKHWVRGVGDDKGGAGVTRTGCLGVVLLLSRRDESNVSSFVTRRQLP